MIKALFDTNVLVSGFASFKHPTRPPAQLLHLWQTGFFEICTSIYIIAEFTRTLRRPYFKNRLRPEDINEAMVLLNKALQTHPEDDFVISAAICGNVDYLVTGDKPLIDKVGNTYQGVTLATPSDFLKILK